MGSIVLIGHRGCGKTTMGRALARRLGLAFADLDEEIARAAGCAIAALFAREGEAAFRARERAAFAALQARLARDARPTVIALGAGFPVEQLAQKASDPFPRRKGPTLPEAIAWLRRQSDAIARPLEGRPRLKPHCSEAEEWAALVAERTPRYAAAATHTWAIGEDEPPAVAVERLILGIPHLAPAFRVMRPGPIRWTGNVPSAKSELIRALILAAQADHPITVVGTSRCDDVQVVCQALHRLGVAIVERDGCLHVTPPPGGLHAPSDARCAIHVGASGAALRFLTPLCAKAHGRFLLSGTPRLHERPMAPLIAAVRQLGGRVASVERPGHAPLRIDGGGFGTTDARPILMDGGASSQFASALLLSAVGLPHGVRLTFAGTIRSAPYLRMTAEMLQQCGIAVTETSVPAGARVTAATLAIEADAGCAALLLAAGALAGETTVQGYPQTTRQADRAFLKHLRTMGASVEEHDGAVRVRRGALRPFTVNCADCPDLAPLLAVCATFIAGTSRITGAPHLRHKESDRIGDLATELKRAGVDIEPQPDGLVIHGRAGSPERDSGEGEPAAGGGRGYPPPEVRGPRRGTRPGEPARTYDDHRLAMSLALLALHGAPVTIADPGVVTKSFPEFWLTLAAAGCVIAPCQATPSAPFFGSRRSASRTARRSGW